MWSTGVASLTVLSCLLYRAPAQQQFQTGFQDYDYNLQQPRGRGSGGLPDTRGQQRGGADTRVGQQGTTKRPETTTVVGILKQINEHNEDGSYTYGYEAADGTFKLETRFVDGRVQGKYGYVDANGDVKIIEYGADAMGFQPQGDLPDGIIIPAPVEGNCTDCSYDYDDYDELTPEEEARTVVVNRARGSTNDQSRPATKAKGQQASIPSIQAQSSRGQSTSRIPAPQQSAPRPLVPQQSVPRRQGLQQLVPRAQIQQQSSPRFQSPQQSDPRLQARQPSNPTRLSIPQQSAPRLQSPQSSSARLPAPQPSFQPTPIPANPNLLSRQRQNPSQARGATRSSLPARTAPIAPSGQITNNNINTSPTRTQTKDSRTNPSRSQTQKNASPSSGFANFPARASTGGSARSQSKPALQVRPIPQASRPASQASRQAPQASRPAIQASRPAPQASRPAPQASRPAPQANRLASQANRPSPQASRPAPLASRQDPQPAPAPQTRTVPQGNPAFNGRPSPQSRPNSIQIRPKEKPRDSAPRFQSFSPQPAIQPAFASRPALTFQDQPSSPPTNLPKSALEVVDFNQLLQEFQGRVQGGVVQGDRGLTQPQLPAVSGIPQGVFQSSNFPVRF